MPLNDIIKVIDQYAPLYESLGLDIWLGFTQENDYCVSIGYTADNPIYQANNIYEAVGFLHGFKCNQEGN